MNESPQQQEETNDSGSRSYDPKQFLIFIKQPEESEIFFGLVGATGTDLKMVELALSDALRKVNYVPALIKLSDLIEEHMGIERSKYEFNRIKKAMDLGNDLRQQYGNETVAILGVAEIRRIREQYWQSNKFSLPPDTREKDFFEIPAPKRAYIFHSLKHPKEVEVLRKIYGESFYVISAYAARTERKAALEKRVAESEIGKRVDRRSKKADSLMRRDYNEANLPHGQNVRDAFPMADLFVHASGEEKAKLACENAVERFVQMIFGDSQQTPTIAEYCMFHAKGAALRSGDAGRQVGAIVATKQGDILSHGTNEAPKAHGGQSWTGDSPDGRGVAQPSDISDQRKKTLMVDLLRRLWKNKRIDGIDSDGISALAEEIFSDNRPKWMKGAELLELIGFYRSVHGETAAIINASRIGVSIKGASLFVTAFPCHECARHILAAGIERVYYIEPYPKSLAGEHYPESIVIDAEPETEQIPFCQFVGIAPRIYLQFFEALDRKLKDGTIIKWDPQRCAMRYHHHWLAYMAKEDAFCSELINKLNPS